MKIYKLLIDVNNYYYLVPKKRIFNLSDYFDGTSIMNKWEKIALEVDDSCGRGQEGDAYGFTIPVIGKRAVEKLKPLFKNDAEFLPVELEGKNLFGVNTITVIDALDRNRSVFKTFSDKKTIMRIEKYAFNDELIRGKNIFKITDENKRVPFVSEKVYKAIEENGLKGFDLKLVYDSGNDSDIEDNESSKKKTVTFKEKFSNWFKAKDNAEKKMNKQGRDLPLIYSQKEIEELELYFIQRDGKAESVIHEIYSPDIHLDILVFSPTANRPYYKLITEGAGAYKQNVPKEYIGKVSEYAEYCIYLPADWKIKSDKPEDYWPIKMLKKIARLPIEENSWFGQGHTISWDADGEAFDSSTNLNSLIILSDKDDAGKDAKVRLSSGKQVTLYKLCPLYQEELDLITSEGWVAYVNKIPDEDLLDYKIIDTNRTNYCK